MTETVRLVLADDHEVTRTGFVSLLAGHPEFEVVEPSTCASNCNRTSRFSISACRCSTA